MKTYLVVGADGGKKLQEALNVAAQQGWLLEFVVPDGKNGVVLGVMAKEDNPSRRP